MTGPLQLLPRRPEPLFHMPASGTADLLSPPLPFTIPCSSRAALEATCTSLVRAATPPAASCTPQVGWRVAGVLGWRRGAFHSDDFVSVRAAC